jgi:hypothetical protein
VEQIVRRRRMPPSVYLVVRLHPASAAPAAVLVRGVWPLAMPLAQPHTHIVRFASSESWTCLTVHLRAFQRLVRWRVTVLRRRRSAAAQLRRRQTGRW